MRKLNNIIIICFMCLSSNAQSLKAFLKAGEEALSGGDYYNAMYYYNTAQEFDTTRIDIKYGFAESARNFNAYTLAEQAYQFVLDNDNSSEYPLSSFYLATVQQNLGKYAEAQRNYELYLSEYRENDERQSLKAENEIEAIEWAIKEVENPPLGITVSRLENDINTPYTEFGGIQNGDEFYYSSLRFEKKQKGIRINRLYSKILSKGTDGPSSPIEGELNEYEQHAAHTSYSHDGSRMYYTLCDYLDELDIQCDLYYRNIEADNNYGPATILPANINLEGSTSTQPSIGYDPRTQEEYLYFASDRPEGKGGLDIWYTKIASSGFEDPVNIDEINTLEDEVSPFYHSPTGTIYFSSNGYMGMGGLDIYSSFNDSEGFTNAENLRSPVNSSFNDLYYSLDDEGTKAYFSSNRTGSLYLEESYEACCYDIYEVDIEEVKLDLNALTFNGESLDSLVGVRVSILDAITGETIDEFLNNSGHEHHFTILQGKEYLIVSERTGFESDTTSLSTRNLISLEEIIKKIYLNPLEVKLDIFAFDKLTSDPLDGVTVVLEEIGGDRILLSETNMESNDFHFDIIAGRRYKLIATKNGYAKDVLEFDALDIYEGVITKNVYLLDASGYLNRYLPINVYFNNDRPDPKSRKMYSDLSYSDTYTPYIGEVQEFQRWLTLSVEGELKTQLESDIDAFFENEVKGGNRKFQAFLIVLQERLEAGDILELSLKGYASPRAANKYNLALGQRRIWTLKNELKSYAGGILKPFIESGRLRVSELSLGEEIAPASVSDSYSDRQKSVFSVEASRERKAEIVKVRVLNN